MDEILLDSRGMKCPKPLMMVKNAYDEAALGAKFRVMLDDEMAVANVERFLSDMSAEPSMERKGNETVIKAQKCSERPMVEIAEYSCDAETPVDRRRPYVIVFTANGMGRGSDELGQLLVQACINSLPETAETPDTLVFYNSGVFLAAGESPVLEVLRRLECGGVRLLVCGTCLDYFGLKNKLKVGIVSNMFEILETLAAAAKVVYP